MGRIRLVVRVLIHSGSESCGNRLQGTELRVGHKDHALGKETCSNVICFEPMVEERREVYSELINTALQIV